MRTNFHASISEGTYNCDNYKTKMYISLSGFKKGLKSKKCPFELRSDINCFYGESEKTYLTRRSWDKFTAIIHDY